MHLCKYAIYDVCPESTKKHRTFLWQIVCTRFCEKTLFFFYQVPTRGSLICRSFGGRDDEKDMAQFKLIKKRWGKICCMGFCERNHLYVVFEEQIHITSP